MRGVSQILAQERPKRAEMVQKWPKYDFEYSGAPKRLVRMAWIELQDILVEVFTQLGACLCGASQILAQERPKRAEMVQKWPKSDFELSGAPKRLEWHGTSYRISRLRCQPSWECGIAPILTQECPIRAKMAPHFGPGLLGQERP